MIVCLEKEACMDNLSLEEIVARSVTQTVDEMSVSNWYDFRVPPTSIVGNGISVRLGEYLERFCVQHVFVVTDAQIVALGLMQPMLRSLERFKIRYTIFSEVEPDPTDEVVRRGVEAFQACHCDAILAFGGGSALDAGKAIAVFSTNPLDLEQPLKESAILKPRPPLVAVPTTAGTGSEVTSVSVLTDTCRHIKVPLAHPLLIPDMAVIDPRLTLGIPPKITAATGIDVLAHAIESYLARGVCTLGMALSYSAMQLVGEWLRIAVGNGKDLEARHKMAVASYMAGMSFSNAGLGLCHAMAHQVGAQYQVPHGMANALLLPEVMRFNLLVRVDRLAGVARAFNQKVDDLQPKEAALKGIAAVEELIADIGLPGRLRAVGARPEDFPALAAQALRDPTLLTNPRSVRVEEIVQVFERAF